jgi:predicted nucleotide-binding protein (sugar kinase/HSP70/actin superfamily)
MTATSPKNIINFHSLNKNLGKFHLSHTDKTFLIPQMNRIGSHLLAATFTGFGIKSQVLETYKGLDLGKEYTSGKECYPCQITTGDILYYFKQERNRLKTDFNPENYVYFMPESGGPCRFGMYNKYQRIVLDAFKDLDRVKIGSLTTTDGYSLEGFIEPKRVGELRKAGYLSVVVTDILERLLWRVRPYEKTPGMADAFIEDATDQMIDAFTKFGSHQNFNTIIDRVDKIAASGVEIIDPIKPRKPMIGIVGEIYLRSHEQANQNLIRQLENYGAEVVNASLGEWVNYTSYERLREAKIGMRSMIRQMKTDSLKSYIEKIIRFGGDLLYQQMRQKQLYKPARTHIDIEKDHKIAHLEKLLKEQDLFCFDAGTEACLSIPGILQYAEEGFNGVVNVFPFTCMPSTITAAIVRPFMSQLRIPYLDTPYDGSSQPGREAAIRTFMYQAAQHAERCGGRQHR